MRARVFDGGSTRYDCAKASRLPGASFGGFVVAMHAPCVGQPAAPCFRAARRCARRRAAAPCAQSQVSPAAVSSAVAARRGGRVPADGAPLKHFVHIDDLTQAQLYDVLGRAAELKSRYRAGDVSFQPLRGMSMAMIFAKPSLRTRVSFETVRPGRRRTPGAATPALGAAIGFRGAVARLRFAPLPALTRRITAAGLCVAGWPCDLSRAKRHPARHERRNSVRAFSHALPLASADPSSRAAAHPLRRAAIGARRVITPAPAVITAACADACAVAATLRAA